MSFRNVRKRAGFTLIELLVVVAIIALLISILLPSLSEAKEQAKVAKCLANMKNMMTGTTLYFGEYNDNYPIAIRRMGNWGGIGGFLNFGKTSDEVWKTPYSGVFYVPIEERVMNLYVAGSKPQPDLKDGTTVLKRTEVEVAHCPSDTTSWVRQSHPDYHSNEPAPLSAYDDIGTSYFYNLDALTNTNKDPWRDFGEFGAGWTVLGRMLVRDTFGGMASTFVFYQEAPFVAALGTFETVVGNHGKLNMHTAAFLDGHAEYRLMDTRRWCGVGWASINPNWVYRLGSGGRPQAVHYRDLAKNCDP